MGVLDRPFRGSAAAAAGKVSRWELRTAYVRMHHDVYVRQGAGIDAVCRARAAWCWSNGEGVLGGFSAAALLGTKWIDDSHPAELALRTRTRAPSGILIRREELDAAETMSVAGLRLTTPARTGFDLGRRLAFEPAVVAIDALCNATGVRVDEISAVAAHHGGARGITTLRHALEFVDGGAESPPETHTRLLLVRSGLPRPQTQVEVRDDFGRLIARSDMGWPEWKVLVEYDGAHHWLDRSQRAWDIDRYELLESLGWQAVRVSSEQLYDRPRTVVARVRKKLHAAGAPT